MAVLQSLFRPTTINWPQKYQLREQRTLVPVYKTFYSGKLPAPDTPVEEIIFLAIDLETTGLNSEKDDIISIGIVPFTLDRIYLQQAREWLVKPRQKLNENSIVIHGITHSDLSSAPDLSSVVPELLDVMRSKVMVAHYHHIERHFIDHAFQIRLKEGIEFPIVDTMAVEEKIIRKKWLGLDKFNLFKPKKSTRLAFCRRRYGLPDYTSHHALTDAIATAELLQAQIRHHYTSTTPIKQFWL